MTENHDPENSTKTVEEWIIEGADLVNRREFHDAHHSFEQPWRHIGGPLRPLCQALVQISAAGYHLERRHLRPLSNLINRARPRLVLFVPIAVGFRIDLLIEDLDQLEAELQTAADTKGFTRPRLRTSGSPGV